LRQSDLSRACHRIDPPQSWLLESQCAQANPTAKFVNISPRTCQLTIHTGTSAFRKARKVSRRGLKIPSPEKIGIPSRYDYCVCANVLIANLISGTFDLQRPRVRQHIPSTLDTLLTYIFQCGKDFGEPYNRSKERQ
jgi:hypothetical protein